MALHWRRTWHFCTCTPWGSSQHLLAICISIQGSIFTHLRSKGMLCLVHFWYVNCAHGRCYTINWTMLGCILQQKEGVWVWSTTSSLLWQRGVLVYSYSVVLCAPLAFENLRWWSLSSTTVRMYSLAHAVVWRVLVLDQAHSNLHWWSVFLLKQWRIYWMHCNLCCGGQGGGSGGSGGWP